jgi:hypothetical protein
MLSTNEQNSSNFNQSTMISKTSKDWTFLLLTLLGYFLLCSANWVVGDNGPGMLGYGAGTNVITQRVIKNTYLASLGVTIQSICIGTDYSAFITTNGTIYTPYRVARVDKKQGQDSTMNRSNWCRESCVQCQPSGRWSIVVPQSKVSKGKILLYWEHFPFCRWGCVGIWFGRRKWAYPLFWTTLCHQHRIDWYWDGCNNVGHWNLQWTICECNCHL